MGHGTKTGVMPCLYQALGFFQYEGFFFDGLVGRQTTLRFPHAHTAACCCESHANRMRGFYAVIQSDAVGIDVEVVTGGCAPR